MAWPCRRIRGSADGSGGVVPGVAFGQEPVCLLRAPGPAGVGVGGYLVAEDGVDDAPGVLDGVLAGEELPLALQRGADEPVVGALVAAGVLGEGQVLGLGFPARAGLFA